MRCNLFIFFLFTFIFSMEPDTRGYIVKVGQKAPDYSLKLTDGSTLKSTDLKGRVVVLQFTASWCSVCRKEMPHLEKDVWQKFKGDNFILIGIDRDEPLKIVKRFKEEMRISYPLAMDPGGKIFSLFAQPESGVTRNIVIDKTGNIVFLTRLFDKKEFEKMISLIEKLLQKN